MLHMRLGLCLTLVVASAGRSSEAGLPGTTLIMNVRVHDFTRASPKDLKRAFDLVGQIFEQTGIDVEWTVEPVSQPETVELNFVRPGRPCPAPLPSQILTLRIHKAPPGVPATALGFSLPCAVNTLSITVFADRIETVARHTTAAYYRVLAHVISHELGHVLLRSGEHAEAGIMRARWDRADWLRACAATLEFTAEQRERMTRELSGHRGIRGLDDPDLNRRTQ